MTLLKRIKSNRGAAITILGIMLILITGVVGIFMIDISKNTYLANIQARNTQMAVKTAVKQQTGTGALQASAYDKFIKEYMSLSTGKQGTKEFGAYRTRCQRQGNYPVIRLSFYSGRGKKNARTYVESKGGKLFNYDNSTLDSWEDAQNSLADDRKAKAFQVTVKDSVENLAMGIVGKSCTVIETRAVGLASSTYDNEDVAYRRP